MRERKRHRDRIIKMEGERETGKTGEDEVARLSDRWIEREKEKQRKTEIERYREKER